MNRELLRFLRREFRAGARSLHKIGAGSFSEAYAFEADGNEWVARVGVCEIDFLKDQFAFQHFAKTHIPIPEIVAFGQYDEERFYAISPRCAGKTLNQLEISEMIPLVPSLFSVLDAMRAVDVSRWQGWGLTNEEGQGSDDSWQSHLLTVVNPKFGFRWKLTFDSPLWDDRLAQALYDEMRALLPYCPSEKYLVHGDFGFDNAMSDGTQITGILDWAEWRLGDFLYDIAYLHYWSEEIAYSDCWLEHAKKQGLIVPHYAERMRCYCLNFALSDLAIAAHFNRPDETAWTVERIGKLRF
ncbi:MAG: aminoglycoside phosphotransferase family protein [Fimbriimonadia bacterium]|nr:aminoglycoside phosphotransferase family protein [Fimbriimonadia bacterium]